MSSKDLEQAELNKALWNAFNEERIKDIKNFIQQGANPNYLGPKPWMKTSLLHKAIENFEIVQVLLECNADPNIKDLYQRTPLHCASENGYTGIVKLLLTHKDIDVSVADSKGFTALSVAKNADIVTLLIQYGAKIDVINKKGETPLHIATLNKKSDVVITLLEHGADPNARDNDGNTPLLNGVKGGSNEIVQILINKGACIDDQVIFFGIPSTLLHYAVNGNNNEIVKTLLQNGYPVNAVDGNDWSAFDSAVVAGNEDIVKTMLHYGANVIRVFEGRVSLHHAIDSPYNPNRAAVVELLLKQNNIDINVKDKSGLSPIYYAASRGYCEIFILLLKYGADINNEVAIDWNTLLLHMKASEEFDNLHKKLKSLENDKIKAQYEFTKIANENKVLKQLLDEKEKSTKSEEKLEKEIPIQIEDLKQQLDQKENEVLMLKQEINKWKCKHDTSTEQPASYTKEADSNSYNLLSDKELIFQEQKQKENVSEHEQHEQIKEDNGAKETGEKDDYVMIQKENERLKFELQKEYKREMKQLESEVETVSQNKSRQLEDMETKLKRLQSEKEKTTDKNFQFKLDDVSKLEVILQPVEDDWYLLGQQLDIEESVLADIHKLQKDVQMKCLIQKWCTKGGTLTELENVLMEMGKKDLISNLYDLKDLVVTRTDVGVQFNYLIPSTDCLCDVHIAGKKLFLIHGDVPHLLNWEEFGLRIGVLKRTLPSSETAEVAVVALVGGQFVFPKNTHVVSAIYAIAVSKPLLQPLRLDLQHCVNLVQPSQTRHLKFVIAPVNTPSLPYKFSPVEGGEFTINSYYGSIYRYKFSLVGIVAESGNDQETGDTSSSDDEDDPSTSSSDSESNDSVKMKDTQAQATVSTAVENDSESYEIKPKVVEPSLQVSSVEESSELKTDKSDSTGITSTDLSYVGMIYYEEKRVEDLVTFTSAKNLNALLKYIKKEHSGAEIGQCIEYCFQPSCDCIELIFDSPQDDPCNGWVIKPHKKPCKKYIDQFGTKDRPIPPSCLNSVYSTNSTDTVPVLHYGIPLKGIDPPVTVYIHRALRSIGQHSIECNIPSQLVPTGLTTKDQQPLDTELAKKVFRKHFAELSDLMTISSNRLSIASRLYSEELITDTCYDEAVDDGPRTDIAKGTSLAKAVKTTINSQPQLITKLISILQNIEAFNSLAVKMSHD